MSESSQFQSCITNLKSSIDSLSLSIEALRDCNEDFPRFKYVSYYEKFYSIYPDFQLDAARSKHAKQFQDEPRILLQEIANKLSEMEKLQVDIMEELKLLKDNPPENLLDRKRTLENQLEELNTLKNKTKSSLIPLYKELVDQIEYRGVLSENSQSSAPKDTRESLIKKKETEAKVQHDKLLSEYEERKIKKENLVNRIKELQAKKRDLERRNLESKTVQSRITSKDLGKFITEVKTASNKVQDFKGQTSSSALVTLVETCSIESDRLKSTLKTALESEKAKADLNSYSFSSLFKSFTFPENLGNVMGKIVETLIQAPNREISFMELNKSFSQSEQLIQELLKSLQILSQVSIIEYEYEDTESQSTFCSDQFSLFEKNTLIKLCL